MSLERNLLAYSLCLGAAWHRTAYEAWVQRRKGRLERPGNTGKEKRMETKDKKAAQKRG